MIVCLFMIEVYVGLHIVYVPFWDVLLMMPSR